MSSKSTRFDIAKNAGWLMALQISSYLVPFLLLPYLARTLGLEAFGELAVGWAVVAYVNIFVDFGFYLWGVRECALHKSDNRKISELWVNIQSVKLLLLALSVVLMLLVSRAVDSSVYLYLFLWFTVVGQSLMPGWLYQGMEKTFWFLVFSILAQVTAAVATLFFVSSPADLLYVPLCAAGSWTLFSLLANLDVRKRFELKFAAPKLPYIKEIARGAWPLFSANIWVALYVNLPALAVGFLSEKSQAATFVGAQKIILAVQALFTPISSAIFPRISALVAQDKTASLSFFKKTMIASLCTMFVISLFLYAASDIIVFLALGENFAQSGQILRIMAFGPFFVVANVLLANHYIVALGYAEKLRRVYAVCAVCVLFMCLFLIVPLGANGAAFVYLFTEIIVFAGLLRVALKIPSR